VSTLHLYEESSGREWERSGVLPDIVTTSEEALTAALEHARETIRVTQRNRRAGH
jgi:C-terminal processing protease CtpA/Prc